MIFNPVVQSNGWYPLIQTTQKHIPALIHTRTMTSKREPPAHYSRDSSNVKKPQQITSVKKGVQYVHE